MSAKTVWLCLGLLGGVVLALGVQYALKTPEPAERASPVRDVALPRVQELRDENEGLRAQLAEQKALTARLVKDNEALRRAVGPAEPGEPSEGPVAAEPTAQPPDRPPTEDELMEAVDAFGEQLGSIFFGGGEAAKQRIREIIARGGKPAVDFLVAKLEDDANEIGLRSAIAHALAQSENEHALTALEQVLADPDADMLELRIASHALAFSDADGIEESLLSVATRTADTGARANAAFGLARRKNAEGLALYVKATDEAMANRDPAGLQYLGGFMLLGEEALPPMRERLLTYEEPQAVLLLIELIKRKNDRGAIENLKKLAANESRPSTLRNAAQGAIKALGGE